MTPDLLAEATGCSPASADAFADPISLAMAHFGITTPQRQAMFLANAAHESGRLGSLREGLNYSVDALIKNFGRHRISEADARAYGRIEGVRAANQQAIANCIYGGDWGRTYLGNTQPGDGWDFRGGGIFQNTGRGNYFKTTNRLRVEFPKHNLPDFVTYPELLVKPLYAALAAGLYWFDNELVIFADRGDFDGVCDRINIGKKTTAIGDSNGYADRVAQYGRARAALGIK